jgi:hypothetical protein
VSSLGQAEGSWCASVLDLHRVTALIPSVTRPSASLWGKTAQVLVEELLLGAWEEMEWPVGCALRCLVERTKMYELVKVTARWI